MDDADLFDEHCRSRGIGRRFDKAGLPGEVTDYYDRYIRRARAALVSASQNLPKLPAVYADFVVDPAFNVWAFKHKHRYFIAFCHGLPLILTRVIYRMLADRRLFPEVGVPKAESASLPLFALVKPDAALLSASNPGAIVPKNAQRQVYAVHLCYRAFDFLAAHEISHIAHGHVDYREAEYGIPSVSETDWLANTRAGNLESQAMELDADSSAARQLVNTVKANVSSRAQMISEVAELYQDPARAMSDVAVAVCIIFRMFGDSRMTGVDLSANSHPPTRWRQMMILNMTRNYVAQFWDSSLTSAVEAAFTKAIVDVEEAFELITGSAQQVHGLHDAWGADGWTYATTVTDCWNNVLRAKLARYAHIEPNTYHFNLPKP